MAANQQATAARGREPGLKVQLLGRDQVLAEAVGQVLDELQPLAQAMDAALGGTAYAQALAFARGRHAAPDTLPSARVLQAIRQEHADYFVGFVLAQSLRARENLLARPYPDALKAEYAALAAASVQQQSEIEAADTLPFEIYRQEYVSEKRLGRPLATPLPDPTA